MIDMVVHRHKMRETLSRLCSLLMHGAPVDKTKARRGNGKATNGSGGEKLIESTAIEIEPVDENQRFKAEGDEGLKREGDTAVTGGSTRQPRN
jgi:acetyl-CoA carboxylase carboxyl transferase subunit beta